MLWPIGNCQKFWQFVGNRREIQEKQEEIARKGEKVSIEDRVILGKLTGQFLEDQKEKCNQLILQALRKEAIDVCLHDLANDEMIFNAAFLLDTKKEETFNEVIRDLDQKLEDTVNFRVVGPLPPYSFSTILFDRINPCELEEAKKLFGLDGEMTHSMVRDAYRHLAQKHHPDKSGEEDSQQFHLIHSAYRTLKNFLESGLMHVEVYQWEKDFQ